MDPFASPLWDLSQATNFSQLPDDDFLALLQKQFPTTNLSGSTIGGFPNSINPQNISQFSLPNTQNQSPEDSTPSSSNKPSPPEMTEDTTESALKRKASDDDLEEGPSQKNQHTASGSKKAANTKRKSSGAGPDETRVMKRKEQNRAAQRAFRERKEKHVKDLEDKVAALEAKNEQANTENENLRDLLTRLQSENMTLKQQQQQSPSALGSSSSFTFSVPKNAASTTSLKSPGFETSMFSSLPRFTYTGPDTNNPLDMTSIMSFDPTVLNLLDDTSQGTATDSAGQMDFNFGPEHSFNPKNYTTIANNPAFFSLASMFDQVQVPGSSPSSVSSPSSASTSSNNDQSSFGFDLNSLTAWTPMSQDSGTLDDLFGGFFNPISSNMDFSNFLTSGPSSSSPVVHQSNINPSHFSGQSPATSASSSPSSHGSDPSLFSAREGSSSDSELGHDDPECPKTKQQCTEAIKNGGASFFAPTNTSVVPNPVSSLSVMNSDMDISDAAIMKTVTCQKGLSRLPSTEANDQNVEVLSAWRSITKDPSFKECDINQLCSEFASKARCDGKKVVIEPQGFQGILDTMTAIKQQRQQC